MSGVCPNHRARTAPEQRPTPTRHKRPHSDRPTGSAAASVAQTHTQTRARGPLAPRGSLPSLPSFARLSGALGQHTANMGRPSQLAKSSAFAYAAGRELTGLPPRAHQRASLFTSAARRFPSLARENEVLLEDTDKVFAAQWISHSELVLGTKCNKLLYYSTDVRRFLSIPLLRAHRPLAANRANCGIHSIAISPSGTFLATGGENPDDVAIYRLPSFEPVALGQGHDDWIFTLTWITDTVLISGSRDGKVMAWDLDDVPFADHAPAYDDFEGSHTVALLTPSASRDEHRSKVRASEHNGWRDQFATLTCDGGLKLWDSQTMQCFSTTQLKDYKDTVCMSYDREHSFYAIGTQSSVVLVEPRAGKGLFQIESLDENWGVRSVSATDVILTVGGGMGRISFFDLRNRKYISVDSFGADDTSRCQMVCEPSTSSASLLPAEKEQGNRFLQTGFGWLRKDDNYMNHFQGVPIFNAVYTHAYDASGTKLFVGGGPLQLGLCGSYAAIWQV